MEQENLDGDLGKGQAYFYHGAVPSSGRSKQVSHLGFWPLSIFLLLWTLSKQYSNLDLLPKCLKGQV